MINVGKCTRIALVKYDKSRQWLADEMGVSPRRISYICNTETSTITTVCKLAKAFGIRDIEFLELDDKN